MTKFRFRHFDLDDGGCGLRTGSDSVLLGARFCRRHGSARSIADIGSGSGVLALLCADGCPAARIDAVEIEPTAAAAARANCAASPWADRLNVLCADFTSLTPDSSYDAIISNPPYFSGGLTAPDPLRAAARHQNTLTYGALIDYARRYLAPDGVLAFISPSEAEAAIVWEGVRAGMFLRDLCRVRTSARRTPSRLLWELSPTDGPFTESTIEMRGADGEYTPGYLDIVKPFYHHI